MKVSRKILSAIFIGASALLFAVSLFIPKAKGDTTHAAHRVETVLKRMADMISQKTRYTTLIAGPDYSGVAPQVAGLAAQRMRPQRHPFPR